MRALVWQGPEQMQVLEMPPPNAEPGTVVIRPEVAGICGSEIEGYLGRMGNRTPPLVMGHEFAGTVTEVGQGGDPGLIGRRVAVNPLVSCGRCRLCQSGLTNVCPNRWLVGIHQPGAFAEYVRAPAESIVLLPEGTTGFIGALAEPLANGVHAVRLGQQLGPVEHSVVIGAGTIGLLTLQAATLLGIENVDVVEPHEARRKRAEEFGARTTYATGGEAREAILNATDRSGSDLVLDCVGADSTRDLAIQLLSPGGCAVFIGLHEDRSSLPFHHIIRNQITVRGSFAYTRQDYERAVNLLVEGRVTIGNAYATMPLERGPDMFAELARGPIEQVKIFLSPSES